MHEFLTRGGPSSPMHQALLAEAADDLTGERRPVPEMGRAGPAEAAGAVSVGPASQVHAGARTAAHGAAAALPAWTRESAAVATLERLGYAWRGGQLWAPPIGGRARLVSVEG